MDDGRFKTLEMLGRGSAGVVYKAEQQGVERLVALKVCPLTAVDGRDVQRFQRECQTLSKLHHPNIVRIFAWGASRDGAPYMALEYVDGETLQQALRNRGALSLDACTQIVEQICDALSYAHALDLVHRDLKPANIMLCQDADGKLQAKLLDFGIAKFVGTDLRITATDAVVGTPIYMAPEQFMAKDISARSDIYALACTLYEALTGCTAFEGQTPYEIFNAHVTGSYKPLPASIPEHMRDAIEIALRPDAASRFASAADFKNAFTGVAKPVVPNVVAPPVTAPRSSPFNLKALIAVAVVLVVGAGAAIVLNQPKPSLMQQGEAAEKNGDYKGALALYNQSFSELSKDYESGSPQLMPTRHAIARMEGKIGDKDTAHKHFSQIEETDYHYMAPMRDKEQWAETLPRLNAELDTALAAFGEDSVEAARTRRKLAESWYSLNDFSKAREHCQKALKHYTLHPHKDFENSSLTYSVLGRLAVQEKNYPDAEKYLNAAVTDWIKYRGLYNNNDSEPFGLDARHLAEERYHLALVYFDQKKYAQAEKPLRQIFDRIMGFDSEQFEERFHAQLLYGICLAKLGEKDRARSVMSSLVNVHDSRPPVDKQAAAELARLGN